MVLEPPVLVRLPPQIIEVEVELETELFVVTVGGSASDRVAAHPA